MDPIAKGRQNKDIKTKETRLFFNPGRGNRSHKGGQTQTGGQK